ncbi:MAG: SH3 domain-containing C40 family peptidase [Oscillospiraceae bacterium]
MGQFAKKAWRVLLFSALLTGTLVGSALAADISVGVGATTGTSVRLRAEASTDSATLTHLDKSVAVAIVAHMDDWYQVAYDGKSGYLSADFVVLDTDGLFETNGRVNSAGVNLRDSATVDGAIVATLEQDDMVTVTAFQDGWYKVTCTYGSVGYIRSDFLDLTDSPASGALGEQIVAEAKKHLGTRYVYGGASSGGFDCSGFTMYVYKQFGYNLPHTASGQLQSIGSSVSSRSDLQLGDLVVFRDPSRANGKPASHVGIYIGDSQFIHASSGSGSCVKVSSLNDTYYNSYYIGAKHVG